MLQQGKLLKPGLIALLLIPLTPVHCQIGQMVANPFTGSLDGIGASSGTGCANLRINPITGNPDCVGLNANCGPLAVNPITNTLDCPGATGTGITFTALGTSPTQAAVTYVPPNGNPCTIGMNEGTGFSATVVNDVSTSLFSGSNSDSRAGTVTVGSQRTFVVGKRSADQAGDTNFYSRALVANTPHHFRVTCGASQADLVLTTKAPMSGATYPERYGTPPTITMSTVRTTDTLTGLPLWPIYFNATFPAGSFNLFCTNGFVQSSDGKIGYVCTLPTTGGAPVLFLDVNDKIFRTIGTLGTIFGTFSGDPVDTQITSQNLVWESTVGRFLALQFNTGTNVPLLFAGTYPGTWQSSDLSVTWSNLTPSNTVGGMTGAMASFNLAYSSTIAGTVSNPNVGTDGDGIHYILNFTGNGQDSIGWVGIFNANGTVAAALPYYSANVSRWCFNHAVGPIVGSPSVGIASSLTRFLGPSHGNWQSDKGNQGDGPYLSYTSGSLTASPAFAVGASVPGFSAGQSCTVPLGLWWSQNLTIQGCDTLTVLGEPCDPTPNGNETGTCQQSGHPTEYFLQTAQIGDHFQAADNLVGGGNGNVRENFVLLAKNGTNWLLGRGASDYTCLACNGLVQNHTGLTSIGAVCSTNFQGQGTLWNWKSDPNGTGSGQSVDYGPGVNGALNNEINSHSASTTFESGGLLDFWNCTANEIADCIGIKYGPNFAWVGGQLTAVTPGSPYFASTAQQNSVAYIEHYTAAAPAAPALASSPVNSNFVIDARPAETAPAAWTNLTGNIYQVTSSLGATYDPKRNVALATCAAVPMADVSSATTSGVANTPVAALNTANTYCIANATNECFNGSSSGNVYANCAGGGSTTGSWITLGAATWGKLSRLRWDFGDPLGTGKTTQPLTNCLRNLTQQSSFWSARVLAGGDYGLCWSDLVQTVNQSALFVMGLPSLQVPDSVDRTTWVPVNVAVPAGPGGTVSAYLQFGYVENGAATAYFCTTRQEICIANAATVPATPFAFAGESPSKLACASGCTIAIPGISGRTVYMQAIYFNGGGGQTGTTVLAPVVIP